MIYPIEELINDCTHQYQNWPQDGEERRRAGDWAEAWYLFLAHYHEGQGSHRYAHLSQLSEHFNPGHLLTIDNAESDTKERISQICDSENEDNPWEIH